MVSNYVKVMLEKHSHSQHVAVFLDNKLSFLLLIAFSTETNGVAEII